MRECGSPIHVFAAAEGQTIDVTLTASPLIAASPVTGTTQSQPMRASAT